MNYTSFNQIVYELIRKNKIAYFTMVTIGLVTYNRSNLISRAIDSVLNQTYTDFELVISDDNSTDNTEEVLNQYLVSDKRVKYVKQKGVGMTQNFIEVLRMSRRRYFMWLCDDDYIENDYLEKNIDFLESNCQYSISCGLTKFFTSEGVLNRSEHLYLENSNPLKRVVNYFKNVESNIVLYGVMRRDEIQRFVYPDVFGADLLWSSQVVNSGKVKILTDTVFYYSKEGISSSTQILANYYKPRKSGKNPYNLVRKSSFLIIANRKGGFKSLGFVESKILAISVWFILRDRFCLSNLEVSIRSKLRIGSRFNALLK